MKTYNIYHAMFKYILKNTVSEFKKNMVALAPRTEIVNLELVPYGNIIMFFFILFQLLYFKQKEKETDCQPNNGLSIKHALWIHTR